jgi:hypothetical protein
MDVSAIPQDREFQSFPRDVGRLSWRRMGKFKSTIVVFHMLCLRYIRQIAGDG